MGLPILEARQESRFKKGEVLAISMVVPRTIMPKWAFP